MYRVYSDMRFLLKRCLAYISRSQANTKIVLPVDTILQYHLMCVPACASIVFRYYGHDVNMYEVKKNCKYTWDIPNFTALDDIVHYARSIGFRWTLRKYRSNINGFRSGLLSIQKSLAMNRPVMALFNTATPAHCVVINGIDLLNSTLYFVDPADITRSYRVLPFSSIENMWHFNYNGNRYVLHTCPRSNSSCTPFQEPVEKKLSPSEF
jgi:ABC-type bacteriocin/lantibiotic exporter with double-glycine peptidase domain